MEDLRQKIPKYMTAEEFAQYNNQYLNPISGRIFIPPYIITREEAILEEYVRKWIGEKTFIDIRQHIMGYVFSLTCNIHQLSALLDLLIANKVIFDVLPSRLPEMIVFRKSKTYDENYHELNHMFDNPDFSLLAVLLSKRIADIIQCCPHASIIRMSSP